MCACGRVCLCHHVCVHAGVCVCVSMCVYMRECVFVSACVCAWTFGPGSKGSLEFQVCYHGHLEQPRRRPALFCRSLTWHRYTDQVLGQSGTFDLSPGAFLRDRLIRGVG